MLVRHPQVLERLRTEIAATRTAPSRLSRNDLKGMRYLQNVLKESMLPTPNFPASTRVSQVYTALRLYPSVPVSTRTALKTTVLPTGGGPAGTDPVLIPKGSSVAFSLYSMHRQPQLYGMDAELFRPERWDEDMPWKRSANKNSAFLPFSSGPRRCPGGKSASAFFSGARLADERATSGLCAYTSCVYSCSPAPELPDPESAGRRKVRAGWR